MVHLNIAAGLLFFFVRVLSRTEVVMFIARRPCVFLAVALLALGGCTAYSDGTTSGPGTTSMTSSRLGSGSTPTVKTSRDPFTLSSCAKFDSMPHECRHALDR